MGDADQEAEVRDVSFRCSKGGVEAAFDVSAKLRQVGAVGGVLEVVQTAEVLPLLRCQRTQVIKVRLRRQQVRDIVASEVVAKLALLDLSFRQLRIGQEFRAPIQIGLFCLADNLVVQFFPVILVQPRLAAKKIGELRVVEDIACAAPVAAQEGIKRVQQAIDRRAKILDAGMVQEGLQLWILQGAACLTKDGERR